MNMAQVKEVVAGVLSQRFSKNGYSSTDVLVEEDFDGEEIIRVTVHLERPLENTEELYESVGEIRERLQQKGDKRFVFLTQDFPGANDFGGEDDDVAQGTH